MQRCFENRVTITSKRHWVVPENIHTHTTGGISEFRRGGGVTSTGIPKARGGYVDWNSEDMGGFIGLEFRRHTGVFRRVASSLL